MTQIETPRLRLLALSLEQLQHFDDDPGLLNSDLVVPVQPSVITPVVARAIRAKLAKMRLASRRDHDWYTYWLIIRKDENLGIGLAGFKGRPNGRAEVEIGYGIAPEEQNQGFMTEAARALVSWALAQPVCGTVTAWTEKNNIASQRVLQKIGMVRSGEQNNQYFWIIKGGGA
ncbi:MAG: GNAT family N-acetyltransferase [Ardenticatenaceae bacterium]|nr:GNAT family N-acetyltransferase [Ardenticatenaceae bacterium]